MNIISHQSHRINVSDEFMGDLGGDSAPLSHRRLEERAIREGWQVPQDVRTKVLKRLATVIDPETVEGAQAELRYVITAARTIISADLRQQAIDLMERKLDGGGSKDTLAEMFRAASEYDQKHGQENQDVR